MAQGTPAESEPRVNAMDRAEMRAASRHAHAAISARDGLPPKDSKSLTFEELSARVNGASQRADPGA